MYPNLLKAVQFNSTRKHENHSSHSTYDVCEACRDVRVDRPVVQCRPRTACGLHRERVSAIAAADTATDCSLATAALQFQLAGTSYPAEYLACSTDR